MPEFQLDCGTRRIQYRALDEFTQGYIEAAFFCGVEGVRDDGLNLDMLSAETWDRMVTDCNDFQLGNAAALAAATAENAARYTKNYDTRCAGRDFWYTRNGHGAGYSARGLPDDIAQTLEEAATRAHEWRLRGPVWVSARNAGGCHYGNRDMTKKKSTAATSEARKRQERLDRLCQEEQERRERFKQKVVEVAPLLPADLTNTIVNLMLWATEQP